MPTTLFLWLPGKLSKREMVNSSLPSCHSPLLYISDTFSGVPYLIDTGSAVSILPPSRNMKSGAHPAYDLLAANGTPIATFGTVHTKVRLSPALHIHWPFIIADVKQAIIGIDLLKHHKLSVNAWQHSITHAPSRTTIKGRPAGGASLTVAYIHQRCPLQKMLDTEFPTLTDATEPSSPGVQPVQHHIETTGSPTYARPRRLSPEKLEAAKAEFEEMLAQGIIRPSKSAWASPIHLVPKSSPPPGNWRVCGDYRQLNSKTKPDRYPVPHCQDFHFKLHGKKNSLN